MNVFRCLKARVKESYLSRLQLVCETDINLLHLRVMAKTPNAPNIIIIVAIVPKGTSGVTCQDIALIATLSGGI